MAKKKPSKKKPPKNPMRQSKLKSILYLLLIGYGLYFWYEHDPVGPNPFEVDPLPPITAQPMQTKDNFPLPFEHRGWELMPVGRYVITGRIIAAKKYDDPFKRIAPVDAILGWGRMANQSMAMGVKFEQQNRYYNMEISPTLEAQISRREMNESMANMHLIPYNNVIEGMIERFQPGMQVTLIGHLVNARSRVGKKLKLRSSTKRNDAGPNASETMLVQRVVIH